MLKKFRSLVSLTKQCKFYLETMSPEDYLINQRESMMTKNIHNKSLYPLKDSSKIKEVNLMKKRENFIFI